MKFVVFGATGQTGKELVKQALAKGHQVVAVVRTPAKLDSLKHDKLEVLKADCFDHESFADAVQGADAVLSTLGFSLKSTPVTGYTVATKAMVKAMMASSCRRLILMHSAYTEPSSRNDGPFIVRWIVVPIIRNVLNNMHEAEMYLRDDPECREIEWTTVLPAGLRNNPVTDKPIEEVPGKYMVPDGGIYIARADVARYMIHVAEEGLHKRNVVAISVK